MKDKMKCFRIPIYGVFFMVNVSQDMPKARKKYEKYFGEISIDLDGCAALSAASGHNFGIFLEDNDNMTHYNIAHELFHATTHIMEWVNHRLTIGNHEPHCYLCGHLTKITYDQLNKWKVKVK